MSVRLRKEEPRPGICMHDMKDGDIGEIVDWPIDGCIGNIVQRYGTYLLCVGKRYGQGWDNMFKTDRNENCRVRILESGEMLEIV